MDAVNSKHCSEKKAKTVLIKRMIKHWQLYLIILIPFAYLTIFKYLPMYGAQIAFKDYKVSNGIWGSEWVGFKHFIHFFNSPYFGRLLGNTIGISLYFLAVGFPIPILLAISINEVDNSKISKTVQTITYAPYFISTVVLVSMIMQLFSPQIGLVNHILNLFGKESINFLGTPSYFKSMYVWSGVWQRTGYSSVIFIAALSGIDPSLHEAAIVDGASRFQKIIHIDIPSIMPTAIILLILNIGQIMNVGFEKVFLMQNPLNMPKSDVIATYVYRVGLTGGQFSFSSAIGFFNSIVNCFLLVSVNQIAKKLGQASLW